MTRKRRWVFGLGAGLALVGLVSLGVTLAGRERRLIQIAHPVMKVNEKNQEVYPISGEQFLVITTTESVASTSGAAQSERSREDAALVDIRTGRGTPLNWLTKLLNGDAIYFLHDFEVSPDGVWLLWRAHAADGGDLICAAHPDGSHYREIHYRSHNILDALSFLDASHFLVLSLDPPLPEPTRYDMYSIPYRIAQPEDPLLCIYDLQDPKQDRKYMQRDQAMAALARYPHQPELMAAFRSFQDEYVGVQIYRKEDLLPWMRTGARKRTETPPPPTQKLTLPHGATMMEAYASRQQKAIVGYLRVVQPLPVFVWLHRMIPRFNAQPTVTEGLWVSRPDGGGWQEIGHVRKEDSDDLYKKSDPFGLHGDPANRLEDIHWLPDGKQVYFRYHGVLYVAPAVPEG